MDPNECKQQFSFAYVRAVASTAGYAVTRPDVDEDSIDLTVSARGKLGRLRSPRLDVQVKCTSKDVLRDDGVHFHLNLKNYDELRADDCLVPRMLIVVLVPSQKEAWLNHSEEELAIRHCGYWISLSGHPSTSNDQGKTVVLPREQQFTVQALESIMSRIASGELP